jgi:hypothetical protein
VETAKVSLRRIWPSVSIEWFIGSARFLQLSAIICGELEAGLFKLSSQVPFSVEVMAPANPTEKQE